MWPPCAKVIFSHTLSSHQNSKPVAKPLDTTHILHFDYKRSRPLPRTPHIEEGRTMTTLLTCSTVTIRGLVRCLMLLTQREGRMMVTSLHFLLPLLISTITAVSGTVGNAVHDMLLEYGLWWGLLLDSMKSFSLLSSGEFKVELKMPCYV